MSRRSKRQRAAHEPSVSEEQVLAAVDGLKDHILHRAATVTTAEVLQQAAQALGLSSTAPLQPHRHAAKRRALELLEEQARWTISA